MREVSLERLKEYMLNNINADDLVEVDKVMRYMNLTSQFRRLRVAANKSTMLETKNGQQEFTKVNPAIEKMATINSQLNALFRTIEFQIPDDEPQIEPDEPTDNSLDDSELV